MTQSFILILIHFSFRQPLAICKMSSRRTTKKNVFNERSSGDGPTDEHDKLLNGSESQLQTTLQTQRARKDNTEYNDKYEDPNRLSSKFAGPTALE